MVERFEYMHNKGFIHRDIKPENFVMGLHEESSVLSVVDMGIAKRFIDSRTK
jgi:serine/threonine protein kinase